MLPWVRWHYPVKHTRRWWGYDLEELNRIKHVPSCAPWTLDYASKEQLPNLLFQTRRWVPKHNFQKTMHGALNSNECSWYRTHGSNLSVLESDGIVHLVSPHDQKCRGGYANTTLWNIHGDDEVMIWKNTTGLKTWTLVRHEHRITLQKNNFRATYFRQEDETTTTISRRPCTVPGSAMNVAGVEHTGPTCPCSSLMSLFTLLHRMVKNAAVATLTLPCENTRRWWGYNLEKLLGIRNALSCASATSN